MFFLNFLGYAKYLYFIMLYINLQSVAVMLL